ncbi:MAG: hypothetical protein KIG72_01890 [Bradymonadales bacterium]|nr:hypothetical protein [Bradymonadales bacterium]
MFWISMREASTSGGLLGSLLAALDEVPLTAFRMTEDVSSSSTMAKSSD